MKRSRPGSSSYLDAPLRTAAPAPSVGAAKVMKIDAAAEPSRPKFLTVASPVSVGESDRLGIGGFLERCYYCMKRIAKNSEVFMYRWEYYIWLLVLSFCCLIDVVIRSMINFWCSNFFAFRFLLQINVTNLEQIIMVFHWSLIYVFASFNMKFCLKELFDLVCFCCIWF